MCDFITHQIENTFSRNVTPLLTRRDNGNILQIYRILTKGVVKMYANFNCVSENNINYSVDMIRLKTMLTYEEFSKIDFRLKTVYRDILEEEYQSSGISNFKYNYHIVINENSKYWFGFIHNSELTNANSSMQNENRKYNFTVEFNPNKVPLSGLLKYILNISCDWVIKSLDMAMDLKVNILDLCRP